MLDKHGVDSDSRGSFQRLQTQCGAAAQRVRKAGIGQITFHGLRHTHITNLLREGVHTKMASERAGYSSVATTLDQYSHATENLQREATEKVDLAMRKTLEGCH